MALSARLCLPFALRLAAFASWFFLFPLGIWAFLTVDLLSKMTDPVGVTASRISEIQAGWVSSLLRGYVVSWYPELSPEYHHEGKYRPFIFIPTSPSLSSTFR